MHTAIPCCTINGEQPALRGQVCQSLLIQEWWWEGRPADPVNVVYLQFEQRWYRLYFEGETVFWRSGEAPRPCENDEGPGEYRLHDLGRQPDPVHEVPEGIRAHGLSRGANAARGAEGRGRGRGARVPGLARRGR